MVRTLLEPLIKMSTSSAKVGPVPVLVDSMLTRNDRNLILEDRACALVVGLDQEIAHVNHNLSLEDWPYAGAVG